VNSRALVVRADGAVRAPWSIALFLFIAILIYVFLQGTVYPLVSLTPIVGWAREYRLRLGDVATVFALLASTRICRSWIDRDAKDPWGPVGLGREAARWPVLAVGLAAGLLTILVPSGLLLFGRGLGIVADDLAAHPLTAFRVDIFLLGPSADLGELITRGYVWAVRIRAIGATRAVILTSLVFGLAHLSNPDPSLVSVLAVMMGGVLLAAVRLATGSLYAAFLAHFSWNFAQAGILAAPVSGLTLPTPGYHLVDHGPAWLTGGSWGPEGGLAAVAGMIVTTFLLLRRPLFRAPLTPETPRHV